MFGIGGWEFGLLIVLALIVFGPERLPRIAGQIGKSVREFQRQASEMQATFTTALNEAQIQEELKNAKEAVSLKDEISEVKSSFAAATTYPALNPPFGDNAAAPDVYSPTAESATAEPGTTASHTAPVTSPPTFNIEEPLSSTPAVETDQPESATGTTGTEFHPAFPYSEQPEAVTALQLESGTTAESEPEAAARSDEAQELAPVNMADTQYTPGFANGTDSMPESSFETAASSDSEAVAAESAERTVPFVGMPPAEMRGLAAHEPEIIPVPEQIGTPEAAPADDEQKIAVGSAAAGESSHDQEPNGIAPKKQPDFII